VPDFDLIAASAYEWGQRSGSFFIWALLAAIAFRIVRNHYARGLGKRAGIVAGLALVLAHTVYYEVLRDDSFAPAAPDRPSATRVEQARIDMFAGCVDAGASRAYCGCITDDVITRTGGDSERMHAMDAELSRTTNGAEPPTVITQAAQACMSLR
jgi:hypothetical protein